MESEVEVPFRNSRQESFTAEQKWALLLEYDKCLERGSKSAFCRRVGIDRVTPGVWLRQRASGILKDPATVEAMAKPKKRPGALSFEERQELEALRRDNEKLKQRLVQEEAAVEILGKAAALLESLAKSAPVGPTPEPTPGRPEWLQDPDTSRLPQIPSKPSGKRESR